MSVTPLKLYPISEPALVPVLLMECFLAGFGQPEAQKYWDGLRVGEALSLTREPAHPHDPRAVRVHWRGAMLGYLPREANFAVSQMLDRGERVEARIAGKRPDAAPCMHILLEVIAMADPSRALPALQNAPPDEEKAETVRVLAWVIAAEAIGKAKASR